MRKIYCGAEGQFVALANDEDYEYLKQWKWSFKGSARSQNIYARRSVKVGSRTDGTRRSVTILMHDVVCERAHGPRPSKVHTVDHRNNDSLDNQRHNLRWATKLEQNINRRKLANAQGKAKLESTGNSDAGMVSQAEL